MDSASDASGAAPIFIVAVSYLGPDLPALVGAARTPLVEHAYDAATGRLAHSNQSTRVGFAQPAPGWPTRPRARRCGECTITVDLEVGARVARTLAAHTEGHHRP
ncbi:hypothetical protein [uncultured Jatrophihabitans sp.]|uniref:hypothetical protein n=1 Tax=uncultured Jatrophihabitans sp. TaxID=1610747 RepID=UPI0035CAD237